MRIVVLGGGFGGVATVRHLERLLRRGRNIEITLVSRENFFVLTPLLFEACSGGLELRHCAQPICAALQRARLIEATVESVDVGQQLVRAVAPEGSAYELPYDHLVVALGASTNDGLIPGSSNALTFKTMADAMVLRNHLIGRFERADAATDAARRPGCLTVVVIGGRLVGVELVGELTAFADDVLRFYPRIRRDEVRFRLFEAGPRIMREVDAKLAAAAARVLQRRGRIPVDATMRSPSHPLVSALGDCAATPGPDGRPYPALAQHTVREARHLASNIRAAIDGRAPSPFMFRPLGIMASLGHTRAVARVFGVRVTGFVAWWLRRTYYLFQMPRWDRRLRIVLDWTVALFFLPDITRVPCAWERAGEPCEPVGGEVRGNSSGDAEVKCLEPPSPSVDAFAASTSNGRTAAPA